MSPPAPNPKTTTPRPGIYDVPYGVYDTWEAINNSGLKVFYDKSPAHYRRYRRKGKESRRLDLGSAVHLETLQPALFDQHVTLQKTCEAVTGSGKQCSKKGQAIYEGKWFCNTRGHAPDQDPDEGIVILTGSDYEKCRGTTAAIRAHPLVSELLEVAQKEVALVWRAQPLDIYCKGLLDIRAKEAAIIADIKTTGDASDEGFARIINSMRYYRQAAWYESGSNTLEPGSAEDFLFIAAETEPKIIGPDDKPTHAVNVLRLDDDSMELGYHENAEAMWDFKECIETGEWPAYGSGVSDVRVPEWKLRRAGVV